MTSEEASGKSKMAKKGIFQEDGNLDTYFSMLWEKFYVFCTPKESGNLKKTIEVQNDLRQGVRNVKNCQKCDSQRRLQSCPRSKQLFKKFKVIWTLPESRYLMEPIGVNDDFRKGIRNVQYCQKGDFQ